MLVGTEPGGVGAVVEAAQSVAPEEPRFVEVRDDSEIRPAVAVEVREARREGERSALRADDAVERDARLRRHVLEDARRRGAAVVEQVADRPGYRGVDRVRLQLGHVEVEPAVAVVVAERGAPSDRLAAARDVPLRRLLGEVAMPVVDVEEVPRVAPAGDEEIEVAVVVDVAERRPTHRPRLPKTRRDRIVLERAVAAVPVEHVVARAREVEVRQPVAVAVADGAAARVLWVDRLLARCRRDAPQGPFAEQLDRPFVGRRPRSLTCGGRL